MRLLLIASFAVVATPVFAAPAEVHQFQRDGSTYNYVETRNEDGSIALTGQVVDTGQDFVLTVANGSVYGTMGAQRVSFSVSPSVLASLNGATPMSIAAN